MSDEKTLEQLRRIKCLIRRHEQSQSFYDEGDLNLEDWGTRYHATCLELGQLMISLWEKGYWTPDSVSDLIPSRGRGGFDE